MSGSLQTEQHSLTLSRRYAEAILENGADTSRSPVMPALSSTATNGGSAGSLPSTPPPCRPQSSLHGPVLSSSEGSTETWLSWSTIHSLVCFSARFYTCRYSTVAIGVGRTAFRIVQSFGGPGFYGQRSLCWVRHRVRAYWRERVCYDGSRLHKFLGQGFQA